MVDKKAAPNDTPAGGADTSDTQTEPTSEATPSVKKPDRGWNISAIFWGLLLITLGGLLLLGNLGLVEVNWSELWRLWPLLVVGAGFSVLATTHWLWKVASVVFIVMAVLAVIGIGTGRFGTNTAELSGQTVSVDAENDIMQADVTVRAGASKLAIKSDDISEVLRAELKSKGVKLEKDIGREGDTQKIVLSGGMQGGVWLGPQQTTWDITMTERLPMKLTIDAGASNVNADLSKVQITNLAVKAGASSTVITLGDRRTNVNVDIDSGASSTVLRIPKNSGVRLSFDGGLSSREFGDLREVSEGEYQSENNDTAANHIVIKANAGAASFKIERY